ncbi:MAG TPA: FAD-dependent oxidoreductase [Jatrophihabitantaceae bacterium]|nr:FAD-dependent oxidoreductase [Jatrophihabitantaceae bacterium]
MADTPQRIVVIGGGLAGAKGVEALRAKGFEGTLTLISDESDLPYERPPLSKDYLQGKAEFEKAIVHPAEWYKSNNVDLRLGVAVMAVDRERKQVELADKTIFAYDRLLLATGAIPRKLDVPGSDAVRYLRSHHDSDVLKSTFTEGKRVVIIGAGWIGLEVAAAARNAGAEVTIVEMAELPLVGVLGPEMAQVFADLHREHGVDLRLEATLEEIVVDDDGVATGVRLGDDETIDADLVVVGVGVAPEDSLARMAGLNVDNGVLVDAALRTSDSAIWAVGDIANHDHPVLRRRIRVEHWANALNQPAVAAASMLGESEAKYDNLPYFFSDQYDLGMEYVGYAPKDGYAKVVVRGDTESREFVAFWLDDENHVLAAMNVNVWDVVDEIKPIIAERTVVDPDRLKDASVGYGDVAAGSADDEADDETDNQADDQPDDVSHEESAGGPGDESDAAAENRSDK